MVFSKEVNPSRGQGYRDKVRCQGLEERGYIVETFDDKHEATLAKKGRHCCGNFADFNRMIKSLKKTWNLNENDPPRYDVIILDYFFSPAGWVNDRWKEKFFSETIPGFVRRNILKTTGALWLPTNSYVLEMVDKYQSIIGKYFTWSLIMKLTENPLYEATDDVRDKLMKCPEALTNDNQIPSHKSFICFKPNVESE